MFRSTWAASINSLAVITAAVEAVVIVSIADLVKALTFNILNTGGEGLTLASVSVTEVLSLAVVIIVTLASVVSQVTDWSRVLAVEAAVMTS